MKANEGVRRKMKVNEGKWRWKKENETDKRKTKEVEEAMLEQKSASRYGKWAGSKMGHVATC